MTAKRFEYKNHKVYDNLTGETHSSNMVSVNVLNELHEENQDLKAFNQDLSEELSVCANARISKDNRIERLEEKIQRERTSFTKTHEKWSKEAETKIKELSEENEQLKIELQRMYDVATLNKAIEVLENKYDKILSDGGDEVKDAMRHTVLRCIEDLDELKDDITAR